MNIKRSSVGQTNTNDLIDSEILNIQGLMIEKQKYVDSYNDRIEARELFYIEQEKLRLYYQKHLMKLVRDLKLFGNNEQNQKMFDQLNEMDEDLNY